MNQIPLRAGLYPVKVTVGTNSFSTQEHYFSLLYFVTASKDPAWRGNDAFFAGTQADKEPNDTWVMAAPLQPNTIAFGNIGAGSGAVSVPSDPAVDQVDFYRFTLQASSEVELQLMTPDRSTYLDLRGWIIGEEWVYDHIRDERSTVHASNSNEWASVTYTLDPGDYRIQVWGTGSRTNLLSGYELEYRVKPLEAPPGDTSGFVNGVRTGRYANNNVAQPGEGWEMVLNPNGSFWFRYFEHVFTGVWTAAGNGASVTLNVTGNPPDNLFGAPFQMSLAGSGSNNNAYTVRTDAFDNAYQGTQMQFIDGSTPPAPSVTPPSPKPPPSQVLPNNMSEWAVHEMEKALEMGLIPDSMMNPSVDFTRPITRAEFAGVSVRVYENLSNTSVSPAASNPFSDTQDLDVLKAYNAGIMVGTSATTFGPGTRLAREQAATALTRLFKRLTFPGWSFATDASHPLSFSIPRAFADDAQISSWAREGVYFMAANGIIEGIGNNMFAPRATTSAQQASGYATATREQALAIAVRMAENL